MSYQITLLNEEAKEYFKIKELLSSLNLYSLTSLTNIINDYKEKLSSENESNLACKEYDVQTIITQETDILFVKDIINYFTFVLLDKSFEILENDKKVIKFVKYFTEDDINNAYHLITISKNNHGVKSINFKFYQIDEFSRNHKLQEDKYFLLPMCLKDINELLNRVLK